MGQEVLYCRRCQNRIVGNEFDRGDAFRIGIEGVCRKCAMQEFPTLPRNVQDQILDQHSRVKEVKERRSSPARQAAGSPSGRPSVIATRVPMAALIGVCVVVVIFVAILWISYGSSPSPSSPTPADAPLPRAEAGKSSREIAAQGALTAAR